MRKVTIKTKGAQKEMNPLIFGHFVEFMRDCIDEGMWSQLLKNRGFDKRKDIPAGVVDGNPNVAEGWVRTGCKNAFEITLDAKESIARDGYAQHIVCYNDYDGYVGIAQENLVLEQKEYDGYIWLKAREETRVLLLIRDGQGRELFSREFSAETNWKKYSFAFCPDRACREAVFEIRLPGEGEIWLDGASLMPSDRRAGIWREVYEHIEALKPPVIRYPGGCFADCYHFADGIGAIDERPYRRNRHWGGYTDNSFGTDEFLALCEKLGCEPMICINFGSGTPQEAANWVEYCNGSADTAYGKMRAQNGHPEPYHVKYWDLGNELFGEWEIGHSSSEDYSRRYMEFYRQMKEKDDTIVFMVCGGEGDCRSQDWNRMVKQVIGDHMDVLCLHMYALKSMEGKRFRNEDIYYAVAGSVKKYEEILQESWHVMNDGTEKQKLLAVTEYNLGTIIDSYREQTLEAAIFNAGMLNMFLRNAEKLLLCNYSDLVNGWPGGCIVSRDGHAFGTASYYALKLYAESDLGTILEIETDSPVYDTEEQIGNIEPLSAVPVVDAAAGINSAGEQIYFVVNRSLEEEAEICLPHMDCQEDGSSLAEVTTLYAPKTSDMNSWEEQNIYPQVTTLALPDGKVCLKPHSVNRIRILKKQEM